MLKSYKEVPIAKCIIEGGYQSKRRGGLHRYQSREKRWKRSDELFECKNRPVRVESQTDIKLFKSSRVGIRIVAWESMGI